MTELKTSKTRAEIGADKPSSSTSSPDSNAGIMEQARGVASNVAEQAKSAVQSRLADRTSKSASELSELADALRQTSRRLEGNLVAPLIERSAARIERVADTLDGSDLRAVVQNVEDFARREPLVFLGGAFATGLLAARFLKGGIPTDALDMPLSSDKPAPRNPRSTEVGRPS